MNQGEFRALAVFLAAPLAQISAVMKQRQQNAEDKQFLS